MMTAASPPSSAQPLLQPKRALLDLPALPAMLAATAAAVVYLVTLHGTYIYDDVFILLKDPRIANPHLWGRFWTQGYFAAGVDRLYRPLVSLSYALQWHLHGDRPWAFHAVNLLLHAGVSAMVAEFTRRCAPAALAQASAFVAGLLFAVHPVHVEAVAQIVGRAELMCALGTLGALLCFAHRPLTGWRVLAILALQALAVLSKEQGILLPLLLLLLGLLLFRRASRFPAVAGPPSPAEVQHLRWLALLTIWTTAGYLILRERFLPFEWDRSFLDFGIQPMVRSTGIDRLLMPLVLLGHYLQLLVVPWRLSPDYGAGVIGYHVVAADPYLWIGIAGILLWVALVGVCVSRRANFAVFCLFAFALLYGMVANLLTLIGVNLAERLMYLPSAFFLMLIALPLARLPLKVRVAVVSLLVLLGGVRTVSYAQQWNDRRGFYVSAYRQQPRSTQLALLVSQEYRAAGDLTDAANAIDAATARYPDYWQVWEERAQVELAENRLEEARRSIEHAAALSANLQVAQTLQIIQQHQQRAAAHSTATTRPATAPR